MNSPLRYRKHSLDVFFTPRRTYGVDSNPHTAIIGDFPLPRVFPFRNQNRTDRQRERVLQPPSQRQVRLLNRQNRRFRPSLWRGDRAPAHKAQCPEDQRNGGTCQPHYQECNHPPPDIHLSRRTIRVACRLPPAFWPLPKTWKP